MTIPKDNEKKQEIDHYYYEDDLDTYFSSGKIKIPETGTVRFQTNCKYLSHFNFFPTAKVQFTQTMGIYRSRILDVDCLPGSWEY